MDALSGRPHRRQKQAMADTWGDTCHLCGHGGAVQADHVVPRSKGGPDVADNYRPAHGTGNPCPTCGRLCNQSRGNRDLGPSQVYVSRSW